MKWSPYMIAFGLAAAAHAGLFLHGPNWSQAQITVQDGQAAVIMHVLPAPRRVARHDEPAAPASRDEPVAEMSREDVAARLTPEMPTPDIPSPSPQPIASRELPMAHVAPPPPAFSFPQPTTPIAVESRDVLVAEDRHEDVTARRPVESTPSEGSLGEAGAITRAEVVGVFQPVYPQASRRRGEQGQALLSVRVRADGSVAEVTLQQSSGHRRLDRAAVEAAWQARYLPARRGGRAVDSDKAVAFTFQLQAPR